MFAEARKTTFSPDFSVRRFPFGVFRSVLSVRHFPFGVFRSALSVRYLPFGTFRSAFFVQKRTVKHRFAVLFIIRKKILNGQTEREHRLAAFPFTDDVQRYAERRFDGSIKLKTILRRFTRLSFFCRHHRLKSVVRCCFMRSAFFAFSNFLSAAAEK